MYDLQVQPPSVYIALLAPSLLLQKSELTRVSSRNLEQSCLQSLLQMGVWSLTQSQTSWYAAQPGRESGDPEGPLEASTLAAHHFLSPWAPQR